MKNSIVTELYRKEATIHKSSEDFAFYNEYNSMLFMDMFFIPDIIRRIYKNNLLALSIPFHHFKFDHALTSPRQHFPILRDLIFTKFSKVSHSDWGSMYFNDAPTYFKPNKRNYKILDKHLEASLLFEYDYIWYQKGRFYKNLDYKEIGIHYFNFFNI